MATVSPTLLFVTGLYLVPRDPECGLVASLLRFEIISATVVTVLLPATLFSSIFIFFKEEV